MSATVITLPVVRIAPFGDDRDYAIVVRVSRRTSQRLRRRAAEWKMSPTEAAAHLISIALDPRHRR